MFLLITIGCDRNGSNRFRHSHQFDQEILTKQKYQVIDSSMDFPIITATTASTVAFLQIFLGFLVGFKRLKTKTGIGDGGNEALARQIRVHGNLIENAPIFLILLVLLELEFSSLNKSSFFHLRSNSI